MPREEPNSANPQKIRSLVARIRSEPHGSISRENSNSPAFFSFLFSFCRESQLVRREIISRFSYICVSFSPLDELN